MTALHPTFGGYRIHINENCDVYDDVPVRSHRKKRLRKKFLKKFGTRRVLVASDAFVLADGTMVMGPSAYRALEKEAMRLHPTGGLF